MHSSNFVTDLHSGSRILVGVFALAFAFFLVGPGTRFQAKFETEKVAGQQQRKDEPLATPTNNGQRSTSWSQSYPPPVPQDELVESNVPSTELTKAEPSAGGSSINDSTNIPAPGKE